MQSRNDRKRSRLSIYLAGRGASIAHALRGISDLLGSQPNARIHLLASAFVLVLGASFGVTRMEWALLVIAMLSVWVAEALNTAVEHVCDRVSTEHHPLIGKAKDVAAGAVLLAACAAVAIGLLVFMPYLSRS